MREIKLTKGLEYKDLEEYHEFFEKFNQQGIKNLNRDEIKNKIIALDNKLNELYELLEKIRDQYLLEEYGFKYQELFKKSITVTMPMNSDIFHLQKKYFDLIMKLYDLINMY